MDVNELAEREIAAIDAAIRALKAGKTSGQISARAVQRKLDELIGAKLRREKLVLAGPRGLALVA